MAENKPAAPKLTSSQLAADTSLFPIWDPTVQFPSPREMCDLDIVTHVSVERAQPAGYHYLHEATIMWHNDRFYLGWANNPKMEDNNRNELIRGRTSFDGLHWNEPSVWVQAPQAGAESFNHPLLFSHGGRLHGFFVAWYNARPTTELFILDESTGKWKIRGESSIPNFLPFCSPQRTADGNWVIGGENHWFEAAVAISDGEDLTRWKIVQIPRPDDIKLLYPETAIVAQGNHLFAVCRPNEEGMLTAPVSESHDGGHTWTPIGLSNFPLSNSKPFAGRLSTGQNYLLTDSLEDGRALLSIAVTGPEGGMFKRIFKVRHQQWPTRRLFWFYGKSCVGGITEWSYPNALERNGNLYIVYSQGKEDCVLSIVPIEALAV